MLTMNKQYFVDKADGVMKLAALLNTTRQSVHRWGDTVPQNKMNELKGLKPGWFRVKAKNE